MNRKLRNMRFELSLWRVKLLDKMGFNPLARHYITMPMVRGIWLSWANERYDDWRYRGFWGRVGRQLIFYHFNVMRRFWLA